MTPVAGLDGLLRQLGPQVLGVLVRREVTAATDEDPEHLRPELPEQVGQLEGHPAVIL